MARYSLTHSLTHSHRYFNQRYNFSTFASEVSKLGVRPSASLTRREWSAIRRRIPRRRRRRFSRNFVISELEKRNQHRSLVRQLQQEPDHVNTTGFDIPAPIQAGATVAAYNKQFRVLHRGVVLSHDQAKHGYLIHFDRKELGYEFCPDTEVASYGPPTVLIHAAGSSTPETTLMARRNSWANIGPLTYICDDGQSLGKCASHCRYAFSCSG
jgi:hypothetical protein